MSALSERDDKLYRAKIAEQVERYDEMVEFMKEMVKLNTGLSVDERNLLSVAYKNAIGARRSALRIANSIEQKQRSKGNEAHGTIVKEYRLKIESELFQYCKEVLALLKEYLISPDSEDSEAQVFYYKMEGDYHRYIAEYAQEEEQRASANDASEAYSQATKIAENKLESTNPIRLGLALNFSVFYYEIVKKPKEACKMARGAFDSAISELDSLAEDAYRESTLIMQLLRDNLTLWETDEVTENSSNPVVENEDAVGENENKNENEQ